MAISADSSPRFRNTQLDILRAVAIIGVLGRHSPWVDSPAMRLWQRAGWAGVDLFFVLSGFLVAGLLFSEYQERGRFDIVRFYVRRAFKIYPSFYVLLIATILYYGWSSFDWRRIAIEAFFFQSYFAGIQIHTWSLAVEEHFYLLLPLLLAWMIRKRGNVCLLPRFVLGIGIVCLLWRCAMIWWSGPYLNIAGPRSQVPIVSMAATFLLHLGRGVTRFDSLFFGVFLSYLYYFRPARFQALSRMWFLLPVSLLLLLPCAVFLLESWPMQSIGLTSLYLGFGGLLVWILNRPSPRILYPLAWVGRYSYSVYLFHVATLNWIVGPLNLSKPVEFILYFFGAFVVGGVAGRLIEMRFLVLRDRLFPKYASTLGGFDLPASVDSAVTNAISS
ncbi:MAG TPA: acyltransferase [Bryobacteraceae bacterium]|nr:acyltransferase [Bryobacteraceae bacterium]